jgi:hypothetical protein
MAPWNRPQLNPFRPINIVTLLWVCHNRRVTIDWMNGFTDHLYTPFGTTLYRSLTHTHTHTHTQTSVPSLLYSPQAVSQQRLLPRDILQFPALRSSCHSRPCRTVSQLTTNWVPGWRPFHTNLLVFSSQTDLQLNSLTHQPPTSRHFTQVNCWQLELDWCPRYITSGRTQQRTPPPTILLFSRVAG